MMYDKIQCPHCKTPPDEKDLEVVEEYGSQAPYEGEVLFECRQCGAQFTAYYEYDFAEPKLIKPGKKK